jgi:hypothetical protein
MKERLHQPKAFAYSHQYRIVRNDSPIWVRAKGQCILDKSGRPERFPGSCESPRQMKEAAN